MPTLHGFRCCFSKAQSNRLTRLRNNHCCQKDDREQSFPIYVTASSPHTAIEMLVPHSVYSAKGLACKSVFVVSVISTAQHDFKSFTTWDS